MATVRGLFSLLDAALAARAKGRHVQVAGVSETLAELVALGLAARVANHDATTAAIRKIFIVLPTAKEISPWSTFLDHALAELAAGRRGEDPQAIGLKAAVLPYYSLYGNDRFINPSLSRRQRIYALSALADPVAPSVIVTTLPALVQRSLSPKALRASLLPIVVGQELDPDAVVARLDDLGYVARPTVEEEGQYALRGGILDVFALNRDLPVRIEFMGDNVASLREFVIADQKSRSTIDGFTIAPAYEALNPADRRRADAQALFNALLEFTPGINAADRDGMVAAFQQGARFAGFDMFAPLFRPEESAPLDYTDDQSALLLFPRGVEACAESYADFHAKLVEAQATDLEKGRASLPLERHFPATAAVKEALGRRRSVLEFGNPFATPDHELLRIDGRLSIDGAPMAATVGAELFDKWTTVIDRVLRHDGGSVVILAHHDEQLERIANLLAHRNFETTRQASLLSALATGSIPPGKILLGKGDLTSHAWIEDLSLLVLPEHTLFGARQRKAKPASQKLQNYLSSFADLKPGDLVVHVQHGIGRYQGMASLAVAGVTSDFLIIEYAGGDKIYLPVDRLNLLQRYNVGAEGEGSAGHSLDKLGGPAWEKRKARVKGAVRDMADELLKIQAKRAVAKGFKFQAPDDTFLKFEAAFPYEETEDQLRALSDVDADLNSGRPMDRLICGDVGFGKTEIALRAALRAVLEGYQVLVLVPTTVLCYQHYRTFESRLEEFGVRVAQVNRFVSAANLKAAVDGLEHGSVDILIGTHRLLSKDIKPKRLGLLVIDEEQRFGVVHKEKLKEMRAGAHILTLTATPIPRTLHMAMVGLRDISIIATPPHDRISVRTYISRFDEALIKDAIETEVRRGGQVFFVHNRVEDIEEMRHFIKTLVPHLEIRVGHGQMREHELEKVIVDFLEQKFPVLLCTTIIESGIDMPNVNTLIVDRADRFGLAQLYQLRGRVGRSSAQAYAYFLTPAEERLTDEGKKRLDVLSAYQDLGAGFQIASHDLELRGAGNLLGGEQSGHAAAVGLELYTQMLDTAIAELGGKPVEETIDPEIKVPASAYIPHGFVVEERQRLSLYKQLFAAESPEDLADLKRDIEDRFGKMPLEFVMLFKVARLKQQLRAARAQRLAATAGGFEVRFASLSERQIDAVIKIVAAKPDKYRLTPDYKLYLKARLPAGRASPEAMLKEQDDFLNSLISLMDPLVEGLAGTT